LIAEHVTNVNPDLLVRDDSCEVCTVRYVAVNAMLLNESLQEHRRNLEQQAIITRLEKRIEALAADLQEVSAARIEQAGTKNCAEQSLEWSGPLIAITDKLVCSVRVAFAASSLGAAYNYRDTNRCEMPDRHRHSKGRVQQ
jgi:hypothetical protein